MFLFQQYISTNSCAQTPVGYHYADTPTKSVDQIRNIVYSRFGISGSNSPNSGMRTDHANVAAQGLPGNDDAGAMASLLVFHLLGLYPG